MALHERLRPPTLELPRPRPSHGLGIGVAFALLAAGFAFAMPRALQVSVEDASAEVQAIQEEATGLDSDDAVVVDGDTGARRTDDGGLVTDDVKEKRENHGRVASAAAHCKVKGKGHRVVSRIARAKDATVEDVEAACAAAIAAAEAEASSDPGKHEPKGRTDRNPKDPGEDPAAKPAKDKEEKGRSEDEGSDDGEHEADDDETDPSDASDGSDEHGGAGKGHSKDKG